MSWLGSTIKSLDTRKELVNYIVGNTQPSRAVVTNSGGEIDSSVVTVAELALLTGISSNVQTQLTDLGNDKEDSITGAATTVTSANLTSDRVLLSDGSGKISASSVTATTLAYLDPTSSIQSQLNGKHPEITTSAPLSQSQISGLASTLSGKQPTIGSGTDLVVNQVTFGTGVDAILFNGDLSSHATTSGLATKQDTISDSAQIAISNVAGLSTAINTVLEGYSQDAGTSINSEDNEISLKTNSVARLQISNTKSDQSEPWQSDCEYRHCPWRIAICTRRQFGSEVPFYSYKAF